jgi:hypothetical protein
MKYLMYCIFSSNRPAQMDCKPEGLGGGKVQVIENNGLAAAVSAVSEADISKDTLTVIAYHKIIETFHGQLCVIPLRFGTIVNHESEVQRLLQEHADRYKSLLCQLEGRVEMSVRVIVADNSPIAEASHEPVLEDSSSSESGAAYLARRKAHHDAQERACARNKDVVERYCSPFKGLFVNSKFDISKLAVHSNVVFSLHFLVPKPSIEPFREAYGHLKSREYAKIMLSGPWPPYNFVLPEDY